MEHYDILVGEWSIEAFGEVGGHARFEWLGDRKFLVQHWTVELPEAPDGIAIIGDGRQHYFDSRGVARVYETTLADGVWRLWRDGPDFAQRFEGRFSEDGDTIDAAWEIDEDGAGFKHDFDMTYRRVTGP